MDPLREALAPVLRDIEATTDVQLTVGDVVHSEADGPVAWVAASDGSATSVYMYPSDSEPERICAVAEHVQEIVIEELWGRDSNWPVCPTHPSSHPMQAMMVAGEPWWGCSKDSGPVARIGTLRL